MFRLVAQLDAVAGALLVVARPAAFQRDRRAIGAASSRLRAGGFDQNVHAALSPSSSLWLAATIMARNLRNGAPYRQATQSIFRPKPSARGLEAGEELTCGFGTAELVVERLDPAPYVRRHLQLILPFGASERWI